MRTILKSPAKENEIDEHTIGRITKNTSYWDFVASYMKDATKTVQAPTQAKPV